jgi:hypothetical protein
MGFSNWGYTRYNKFNSQESIEITEASLKKEFNLPTLTNIVGIKDILDSKVKSGELSIMTEENFPFRHFFYKEELKRRLKIATLIDDITVDTINDYHIKINGKEYQCEEYITSIQVEQSDSTPQMSDDTLKQILHYCEKENISHIFNIGQYREGISFDTNSNNILSLDEPVELCEFWQYGFNINKKVNYQNYHFCIQTQDVLIGDNDDTDHEKICDEVLLYGYVFNKSYYSVVGIKSFSDADVAEWQKCLNSMDYFYKNYMYKKNGQTG